MELLTRSVREFVSSVASTQEPVPAGGSVAALTGAGSAALLALVCDIRGLASSLDDASRLQRRLLELVEEDAAAFQAFLDAKTSRTAVARIARTPLQIASACREVVALSQDLEVRITGPLLGDVRAARHLASAAAAAALDIAEQNVPLIADPDDLRRVRAEIAEISQPVPRAG